MRQENIVVQAWRIVSQKYAASAFDGEGARLYGGRWNSRGTPLVYTAGTLSLAALEQLVHLGASQLMTGQFAYIRASFPDEVVLNLEEDALPEDWRSDLETTRFIGDSWAEAQDSLVLKVPSAVLPEEHNFLINPRHPDAKRLRTGPADLFAFDPRLVKVAGTS